MNLLRGRGIGCTYHGQKHKRDGHCVKHDEPPSAEKPTRAESTEKTESLVHYGAEGKKKQWGVRRNWQAGFVVSLSRDHLH
jgi:hypothetical protein